jgi:hypothetical protein
MGSTGDRYDKAMMEAFWSRMQVEILNTRRWKTRGNSSTANWSNALARRANVRDEPGSLSAEEALEPCIPDDNGDAPTDDASNLTKGKPNRDSPIKQREVAIVALGRPKAARETMSNCGVVETVAHTAVVGHEKMAGRGCDEGEPDGGVSEEVCPMNLFARCSIKGDRQPTRSSIEPGKPSDSRDQRTQYHGARGNQAAIRLRLIRAWRRPRIDVAGRD